MNSEPTNNQLAISAMLSLRSEQVYDLVVSSNPTEIENLIARLFREYFLESPDRSEKLLERLGEIANDPVLRSMACAIEDDEPLTDDDLQAIEEALDDVETGKVVSHEQLAQ